MRWTSVKIETKRLVPRPFLESDAADVYEYLKQPAVNCFACMKLCSLEEAKAEMRRRKRPDWAGVLGCFNFPSCRYTKNISGGEG